MIGSYWKHLRLVANVASLAAAFFACDGPSTDDGDPSGELVVNGERVIVARAREGEPSSGQGAESERVLEPQGPDPEHGEYSLAKAVSGLEGRGTLVAEFSSDLGTLLCDLLADEHPEAVAHFIGRARGKRPFWDEEAGLWAKRRLFHRSTVSRVVPDAFIELVPALAQEDLHVRVAMQTSSALPSRSGQLAFLQREPHRLGPSLIITDGQSPHFDTESEQATLVIFGQCRQPDVVRRIARVPQHEGNRPRTPLHVRRVRIRRVSGGARAATPTQPVRPRGFDPARPSKGVSGSPSSGGHAH